jgi:hypothetical protein
MTFSQASLSLGVSRHRINQRGFLAIQCKNSRRRMDMADLRITGVSNNQLELQAPDGTRHYLEISDDLLKAMKSRQTVLPTTISPREIQQEIRLGATISELVASSGADEDLISKFAAPIISELNHVVLLARNVRLSLAGDRFTDPTQVEFGNVMDERPFLNGARNLVWSSRKSLEGDWLVSAKFTINEIANIATWSFDPKQLFLVPENETALQLSNGLPITANSAAKIRNLETETASVFTTSAVEQEEGIEQKQSAGLSIVPEIVVFEEENSSEEEIPSTSAFHVVQDEPENAYLDEPLDELFEQPVDEVIVTEQIVVVDEIAETPKTQSTSRWAEVLFGAKEDDEES